MRYKKKIAKFNKEKLRDKIYACWIGKNIGGTIGTPFEGCRNMIDIQGFTSEPGKPLPNDDLDLQLMWLLAMEQEGPWYCNSRTLGEYWLLGISPHFNEYGRALNNLADGVPAPLSGEFHNEIWRHSNGGWIRSEIWATLCAGFPSIAREYAYADACIDHGMNEGTLAEIFTASLQAKAVFASTPREAIEEGLRAVPETSRVYKAVKLVMDEYDKGTDYHTVREMLVEQSKDIGMFQAPANLGFVTIGLLYGEGDFKKSMIYAVNCGDDTDCTGATVGATLGLIQGTAGIPEDWAKYIGDSIDVICIQTNYLDRVPKTCTELTDRVIDLLPIVLYAHGINLEWTDGEEEVPDYGLLGFNLDQISERGKYCFDLPHLPYVFGFGEYDRLPLVKSGEQLTVRLKLNTGGGVRRNRAYPGNNARRGTNYHFEVILPEGWSADYRRVFNLSHDDYERYQTWEATITVGEKVDAINHVYVFGRSPGHNQPLFVDCVIEG